MGGIIAVGFILVREMVNDTITSTDVLKEFEKPVLGAIPDFSVIGELDANERQYIGDKSVSNQLITLFDHISPISEAYRRLRINVVYANPDKEYKILMVSSATKGEGKSTVAANLAVTFTGSEKKYLSLIWICADLHSTRFSVKTKNPDFLMHCLMLQKTYVLVL